MRAAPGGAIRGDEPAIELDDVEGHAAQV